MMNNSIIRIFKPFFSLSSVSFLRKLNNQVVFNTTQKVFSEQIRLDIRRIENIWRKNRNRTHFNNILWEYYARSSELASYTADLIHCACTYSFNSLNSDIVFDVLKSLDDYLRDHKITFTPTAEQKIDVLTSVLPFKNYLIIQLICDVFKIHDQPIIYKEIIENLKEQRNFSCAAFIVSALHLQNDFEIEEILTPLLLDGHVYPAITYMNNYPDIQIKAAKFLDSYLNPHATAIESRLRKVYKTLSSIINACKIPIYHCPNMEFIRSRAAISLLIHRRKQQSISEETWEDMIKNIVGNNADLKKCVVQMLVRKKDTKTALKMAENYNMCDTDFLNKLIAVNENFAGLDDQSEEFEMTCDSVLVEDEYLKFGLKPSDIKVVENKEDFMNCINEICQNYDMIGIDSEWKPNFGLSEDRLALIQLAARDKVFIFDVLILSECLETQDWDAFLDKIFGNPKIIKLGCGIMSDVHMILDSIKGTKGKAVKFSHILDMALFYQKLQEVYPIEMKCDNEKDFTKGLSSLCDLVLGKPLSKEERLCDWEKRPLLMKQLEYAALDAHCLLQIYDKLKEDAEVKNMNFEHLSKVAIVVTTSQWKPKRKYKGVRSGNEFQVQKLIRVDQLKLLVDSSFEKKGKELRRLGADVVILDLKCSADEAVMISEAEERIIVCSEEMYDQLKSRVKDGLCVKFQSNGVHLKVSQVMERFNAHFSAKTMYTRCITCNSNNGIKLSVEDVSTLEKLCKISDSTVDSAIENNLSLFSLVFQETVKDILNSNINIKYLCKNSSSHLKEFAFLCKSCGDIS